MTRPLEPSPPGVVGRPTISVVAPVYNEAGVIGEFISRLGAVADQLADRYVFEFVLVDDGSSDDSNTIVRAAMAMEPRLKLVELRRNFGQTAALQAGLDVAVGEVIVTLDADLQHFPEEIPAFIDELQKGYDVVCGWRHQRQEGVIRRWPSKMANILIRRISGLSIHDIGTTFRIYRREVVSDLRLMGEGHRFIPVFASAVGAKIGELPIRNIERPIGKSNYGLARTLNVLIDLFFLYFFTRYVDRPIRIFGKIALLALTAGGTISLWLLGVWLIEGVPVVRVHSGWFTLAMMLLLSALQLLLAGIACEMLARIYFSPKDAATTYKIRKIWTHPQGQNPVGRS